jgi:hypothetical protein
MIHFLFLWIPRPFRKCSDWIAIYNKCVELACECVLQIGRTPLYLSSSNGRLEVVQYLIEKCGAPVSELQHGCTPLHLASLHGNLDVVQYLVEKCGANWNAKEMVSEF